MYKNKKLTNSKSGGGYLLNSKLHKGFSLIELIAVIIVIAVLALILTPIISNLIRAAKIRSAVVSAYGYVASVNNRIIAKSTTGENIKEDTYDVIENILGVKYEGKGPSTGYYNILKDKVEEGEFCINGFDIKYENGKATYIKDGEICPSSTNDKPVIKDTPGENLSELCKNSSVYDKTDEYKISKVEDLVCLAKRVNEGNNFEGKIIRLANDIDFKDKDSYISSKDTTYGDINGNSKEEELLVELTTGDGFDPIGNETTQFMGGFDGQNHIINNLMINRKEDYVGLFGYVKGIVEGINLKNANVTGLSFVGSVTGYNVGYILGINVENINLLGNTYVGGIAGYNGAGIIEEVVVRGKIKSSDTVNITSLAGIAGYNTNGVIKNVLVNVDVSGLKSIGGIVGTSGENTTLYGVVEGNLITATEESAGKAIGEGVFTGNIYVSSDVEVNRTLSNGNDGTSYSSEYKGNLSYYGNIEFSLDGATYPLLENRVTGDINHSGYWFDYNDNGDIIVVPIEDILKPNNSTGGSSSSDSSLPLPEPPADIDVSICAVYNGVTKYEDSNYFEINFVEDLVCLSNLVNAGNNFSNKVIVLTNNLDFTDSYSYRNKYVYMVDVNGNSKIEPLSIELTTGAGFKPIGKSDKLFEGTINGKGYTISNLMINRNENYASFIGYVGSKGEISNINFNQANVKGLSYTSVLTGQNAGNISSVKVSNSKVEATTNAGVLVGSNSGTIADIHLTSTIKGESNLGGVVGYNNGNISNVFADTIVTGSKDYIGGVIGSNVGNVEVLQVGNIEVSGNNYVGGLMGNNTKEVTLANIRAKKIKVTGNQYIGSLVGNNTQGTYNSINFDNIVIKGSGYIGGLIGKASTTNFDDVFINKVNVDGASSYVGGLFGYASSSSMKWVNINDVVVSNKATLTGGVAGYTNIFNVDGINLKKINVTSTSGTTGGLVGNAYKATFRDTTIRGNVTGTSEVGGFFGYSGGYWANGEVFSMYAILNVTGTGSYVGGMVGYPANYGEYNTQIVGVLDGGSITHEGGSAGKMAGANTEYRGLQYISDSVVVTRSSSSGVDGTSYSSEYDGNLSYLSSIVFEGRRLIESPESGDLNNNGFWANYVDGGIYITKVDNSSTTSSNTGCVGSCGDVITTDTHIVDGCTTGDVTPPTCEFYYMKPLLNGIMASFSCTDDSGVPSVYSMFNSVKNTTYTAQEILARSGTKKTGTASGNTRNITSRWTTAYSGNKPEPNRCYFYQYTAVDSCGNSSAYVTNYCQTGFAE